MAQYYTKNGSIPTTEKDDSPEWFAAPDKPDAPEGCEVVWWYPPGWVIRPIMPVKAGFKYKWSQTEERWMEFEDPTTLPVQGTVVDATDDIIGEPVQQIIEEVVVAPVEEITINLASADTTNDPTV